MNDSLCSSQNFQSDHQLCIKLYRKNLFRSRTHTGAATVMEHFTQVKTNNIDVKQTLEKRSEKA